MKRICFVFLLFLWASCLKAQQIYFSDSLAVFYSQVSQSLRMVGTEAAIKVAFDFNNAWSGKFTTKQQRDIHEIALLMQKKGYPYKPFFWHFFSYLAFSTEQASLNVDQVTEVLSINKEMVKTMEGDEYRNFLLGLNTFMARRILSSTKSVFTKTDGGSFTFRVFGGAEELAKDKDPSSGSGQESLNAGQLNEEYTDSSGDESFDENEDDSQWASWSTDDSWGSTDDWSTGDAWTDTEKQSEDKKPLRQKIETIAQDYVQAKKSLYQHPESSGPGIELENNSILISTRNDSFNIKESDGVFLLRNRVYAGRSAIIHWPQANYRARGAEIVLGEWMLRPDRDFFWTPNATLTFPQLFNGSVEGVFEFRSLRRRPGTLSSFPVFTSNKADVSLNLPGSHISYRGGIQISGNKFTGTAVSKQPGTLTILDESGNTIVFRAEKFLFEEDSTISSKKADFVIRHGEDSVFHPSVEMRYDSKTQRLVVLRTKEYDITPFFSTFFEMNIGADLMTWDLKSDSVNFSILNGKDMVPVTLESKDFFSTVRFSRLAAGFNFHPVITSVFYSRKYNTKEFTDLELVAEFKITENQAKSAMKILHKYGFADYDIVTGKVKLKEKAFLYYKASARKVDYDNLMIPSHEPDKPNVTWLMDSSYLKVRGVDRFYLTGDFKIYAEPLDGELKVLEGRNIKFDGMLSAGDFQYKGNDYKFDYDGFLVDLKHIDSIRINVEIVDTTNNEVEKRALSNHLNRTSGIVYLNEPDNKSNLKMIRSYPYLISDSEATVYFDGPEILNGAYDKSVRFVVPPFEADSAANNEVVSYHGVFNSGGIFPTFEETLRLMPDRSLGFEHQIPKEGYTLYGTEAKTYEQIRLDNNGIRGGGKIDFITSTFYSEDFVYFPDSLAAVGMKGEVRSGKANGVSYPPINIGPYRMHWEPRIDSMHLKNLREPFDFYNSVATLDGAINITGRGVYGMGKVLAMGSRLVSDDIEFTETTFRARHADFEVLTDNPQKPAMRGDDVRMNFHLTARLANISPEKSGVAAISFPYAQMNTSITNAVWDLDKSIVTMTKQPAVPIEKSYFYTTRPELDSLAFNAEQAVYDMNTKELHVTGIPYIMVADAKIIPEGNETTILENAELQTFSNAEIIIDTLNEFHRLYQGEIKIHSRNAFSGYAIYRLNSAGKTFDIRFNEFELKEVKLPDGERRRMTVSGGAVPAEKGLIIAPGFTYKGQVEMYAYKEALELLGFVKPMMSDPSYDYWIKFERYDENTQIEIDVENAYFEDDQPVISGIHYDINGELYMTFAEKRERPTDQDLFLAKGIMSFDTVSRTFEIENPKKASGESYAGHTFIYNDASKDIVFEGPVTFLNPLSRDFTVDGSLLGVGNESKKTFSIDGFFEIDFKKASDIITPMAEDLQDIIQRFGSPEANDLSIELMYKLANLTSDKLVRHYETSSLKDYKPLYTISDRFLKALVISGAKMKWSAEHRSWYSTSKIGISNIYKSDINAKVDGFMEIRKDDTGNDIFNLFIQAAPGSWYYLSFANNTLLVYSSNAAFNAAVDEKSNFEKARPGEMVLVKGDENETLTFINSFREKYFGITQAYDLISPVETKLEDESFETIQKEKDDGFGF